MSGDMVLGTRYREGLLAMIDYIRGATNRRRMDFDQYLTSLRFRSGQIADGQDVRRSLAVIDCCFHRSLTFDGNYDFSFVASSSEET